MPPQVLLDCYLLHAVSVLGNIKSNKNVWEDKSLTALFYSAEY